MKEAFLSQLKNPPKVYRPVPFWSWNERLSVAETRRQIAEMDEQGHGGYFMHARGGLQTPYMGEEWMANIQAGVDEGRKRGMGAWAYDENGWPSGFGDGKVNGRGEIFQQKYLRCEKVEQETTRRDGRTIANVRQDDGTLFHFYYDVNPYYVDTLDLAVVRTFLEEIYAPYEKRFSQDFGVAMPGFFTDEPQVSRNGIPWSLTLPDRYREAYGDDLAPHLPSLFFQVGEVQKTRYRFWLLVQELFVTHFTKQIFDWCNEHGAKLTGHMVLEETLLSQITSNGSVMPHYEFFHMAGMDWLCRHIEPPTTPLQVASVAHQLGKKQVLSETFALTGWNVSFEELKWMFEWQMVRGATLLCQHLEGYSLRGIRKRDYPPSLFTQQPWWNQYRFFNDAMSRIGFLLSEGEALFEVLVIHPQSSAWLHFDNGQNEGLGDLNDAFFRLTQVLEQAHVPFHYGDERILKRHGAVEGARLRVGLRTYSVVIVPPIDVLAMSTVCLLREFVEAGGTLIWQGRQPTFVDGAPHEALACVVSSGHRVDTAKEAIASLPSAAKPISVSDGEGTEIAPIAVTWRDMPMDLVGIPCRFYFLANADAERDFEATITVVGASAARIVAEDGSIQDIPFERRGDHLSIRHTFARRGSLGLLVSDERIFQDLKPGPQPSVGRPLLLKDLGDEWDLKLVDENALALDTCDIWFDDKLEARQEHISVVQVRALKLERPVAIRMRFEIRVAPEGIPPGETFLVVETPKQYRIKLNDAVVSAEDAGYYRDTSFRKLNVTGLLREGLNELWLETTFMQSQAVYEHLRRATVFEAEKNKLTYDMEIEALYLVGAFGVATPGAFTALPRNALRYDGPFLLGPAPKRIKMGDLTEQGLPFFNGQVRLTRCVRLSADDVQGRKFRFNEMMCHIAQLSVNGTPVRPWFWRPFEADLDGLLREGDNTFEITLTAGLRNLLGPHHLEEGESYAVCPSSFFKEPNIWGHQAWNDAYCFMPFGIR